MRVIHLTDSSFDSVPWLKNHECLVAFTFRTFLDYLPEPTVYETSSDSGESSGSERSDSGRTRTEEKKTGKRRSNCDYERYKTLIQNDYLCIDEAACLKQIYQEEEHGGVVGLSSSTAAGAPPNGSAPLHALDKSSKSSTSTTASSTTSTAKVGSSNYSPFFFFLFIHYQSQFGTQAL